MIKLFKYVLELQRQNTLYKRAIGDLLVIVKSKKAIMPIEYDLEDDCLHFLFQAINELLKQEAQYPSDNSSNTGNRS